MIVRRSLQVFGGALLLLLLVLAPRAHADELRPGYLQLVEYEPDRFEVFWKVPARAEGVRLSLRVAFDEHAVTEGEVIRGSLDGASIEHWRIYRPGGLANSQITIDGLSSTSTEVLLRLEYLDGVTLSHRFFPAAPTYRVAVKPTWLDTVWTYLVLGVEHILFGVDHLLFVLCLLLLVSNLRKLIWTITAFTVAHSVTLILSALETIRVPVPPVEACIALSIVFVASEIVHGVQGRSGITQRAPWVVALSFGLLHGLGFAAALADIGLPQSAIPLALVAFNVGVEVGQLLFVGVVVACALAVPARLRPRWAPLVPAYLIGTVAAFWTLERLAAF